MEQGKLTNEDLRELILNRLSIRHTEVAQGPGIGEDCAAVDTGGMCVLSTDPITAVDRNAGLLAVHINANDVASAGAIPLAALVTILAPVGSNAKKLDEIIAQLVETATEMNIDIIGGHTEVTSVVRRPLISLTMIGKPVVPGRFLATADMRAGDAIIMSKYAGIEGTLILAAERGKELERVLDSSDKDQIEYLKSCLSVLPEGIAGAQDSNVSSMHDITEGGLVGACEEMCTAAGLGMILDTSKVPVLPVTKKICKFFDIDVLRLISSGSMLIAASEQTNLLEVLAEQGIAATVIGHAEEGVGVTDAASGKRLTAAKTDELYRVFHDSGD